VGVDVEVYNHGKELREELTRAELLLANKALGWPNANEMLFQEKQICSITAGRVSEKPEGGLTCFCDAPPALIRNSYAAPQES